MYRNIKTNPFSLTLYDTLHKGRHTDPEAGIGFSECQKGSEGNLEFCEQYENRI